MIEATINRFLHWSVVGLLSPVLVLMIMSKGVGEESIGLVMAAMSATVVILELPSGVLSDLIGRRRVYLASILLAIAALTALYFSRGPAGLVLGFVLYGASRAFSSGSIESSYIDDFLARKGKERLHSLIAAMNVGEAAGLALGALAGGWIPMAWGRLDPSGNRFGGNLIAQLAILLALLALTLLSRHRDPGGRRARLGAFIGESRDFLRGKGALRLMLLGTALWGASFNAIELYWQPRLRDLIGESSDTAIFGIMNGGYFLAAMLGSLAAGAFLSARRLSALSLVGGLRILAGIAILALSAQPSVPGFAFFFLAIMGLNGMAGVPEGTALNAILPEGKRASFLSLASLAMQLGGIAASLAFGLARRFAPIGAIWAVAGCLFLGSSALYFRARRPAAR
jgi:DHA1 family quinolone resistance protein-like MFS transporter